MFSSPASPRKRTAIWRMSAVLIIAASLLLTLAHQLSAHSQSAILKSFSAACLIGQPEIYIEWETVREPNTVGFFIRRGLKVTMVFTRVSDFFPHEGDNVTGNVYDWVDETSELSQTYYYRLEVINTDATSNYYGPLAVTAGIDCRATLFIPRIYLPLIICTS